MKQFWLVAAAAVLLTSLLPNGAFAQRGGFRGAAIGGGFRGAAIGGGFRGAAIGGGFRGAPIGGAFRTASIGGFRSVGPGVARIGPGFRGAAVAPGIARVGPGFRAAAIGPGFRGAHVAAFRGAGWRWRRGWGWGWPVAFGLGVGAWPYYASSYSDSCIVWDGYAWVNVCYPYEYY
jgi:hypothetical protein